MNDGDKISDFLRNQFGIDAAVTVAVREDKDFPRWRIDVVFDHYTGIDKVGYFSNEDTFDTSDSTFIEQAARSILTCITARSEDMDRLKAQLAEIGRIVDACKADKRNGFGKYSRNGGFGDAINDIAATLKGSKS